MSGPDIRGCNVLIADGVDDWKVVALFVVGEHFKCHSPDVLSVRIDRVDIRNIMAL